jgi:hypothetical protein
VNPNHVAAIYLLSVSAPAVMDEDWPAYPAHCILSTRIGIAVLEYFGVDAMPLSVRAGFMNREAIELMDAGHPESDVGKVGGSWGVGIGVGIEGDRPGHWDGHLVIRAADYILDLNSGPASRPQRAIPVPASLVLRIPPDFITGQEQYAWPLDHDVTAVYKHTPANDGWRKSPDWTGDDRHRATAGRLIRVLRDTLAEVKSGLS